MKFTFLTNSISPHQLPLARELVSLLGHKNYSYIYTDAITEERKKLGWDDFISNVSCKQGSVNEVCLFDADILMSGIRSIEVFEKRVKDNKKTLYCSERWFKPPIGFLRVFVPSYFKMAWQIVKLLKESENFYYLPMGIHAARDMARLCGLMNGDWKCLFRSPKLEFERKPGGRIWISERAGRDGVRNNCVDKMRMWGYFVEEGIGNREKGKSSAFSVKECDGEGVKVLWVGRLLKWKRVDTIIRAVGECAKSRKITLDIYGLGPEEAKLKKLAAKYDDIIRFYPPVPITEVRNLMRVHDIYVLSSNAYEGWGAVVSEALEEGMRVIGTYEAGSSATILPESSLFHAGDWRRLKELLEGDVERFGIGPWTAKSAAEFLLTQRWGGSAS
jgi:glycosyltransferase involved in cell wall biosynthesis